MSGYIYSKELIQFHYINVTEFRAVGIQGAATVAFLSYALDPTQQLKQAILGYTPLPPDLLSSAHQSLHLINYDTSYDINSFFELESSPSKEE